MTAYGANGSSEGRSVNVHVAAATELTVKVTPVQRSVMGGQTADFALTSPAAGAADSAAALYASSAGPMSLHCPSAHSHFCPLTICTSPNAADDTARAAAKAMSVLERTVLMRIF
ncbi:MAG: hypothetical protein IJI73_00370 [Kiritimatiellae bacterium]|nr:hypothetical protein [Kiritimatiellia bacterium]